MPLPTSALPFALTLATVLAAQAPAPKGGGSLTLGKEPFRFQFESVNLAPAQPKLKLPRAFVLRGKLVPEQGPSLAFELTALEDGRIYGLRILRKRKEGGEDDRWGAAPKTKVEILALDAQPQGKLRIALSGPLTYVQGAQGGTTTWSGELWGTFESVPL